MRPKSDTLAAVIDDAEAREQRILLTLVAGIILGCALFAYILCTLRYKMESEQRAARTRNLIEAPHAR